MGHNQETDVNTGRFANDNEVPHLGQHHAFRIMTNFSLFMPGENYMVHFQVNIYVIGKQNGFA